MHTRGTGERTPVGTPDRLRTRRGLARPALALAAVPVALAVTGPGAAAAPAAQDDAVAEVLTFARTFATAWGTRDPEAVLALFAPDAVITLAYGAAGASVAGDYEDGPLVYGGPTEPFSLRMGVAALADGGVRIDPSGHQPAAVDFRGIPATLARWPYRRDPPVPALPPELGTDSVVLRAGRILAYTRTPDRASLAAQGHALDGFMRATASQTAGLSAALRGSAPPPAEPDDGAWPLGLSALGTVAAAIALWRRHSSTRA